LELQQKAGRKLPHLQVDSVVASSNANMIDAGHLPYVVDVRCGVKGWPEKAQV